MNIVNKAIEIISLNTYYKLTYDRYLKTEASHGKYKFTHVSHQLKGNVGDTVLAHCVRTTFDHDIPHSWQFLPLRSEVNASTVSDINSSDALIIGGGGVFLPDGTVDSVSGWQWPCPMELLDSISVPVVLYSVGYNYFRCQEPNEYFKSNLNAIINKASFVGLRNTGSIRAISGMIDPSLKEKLIYQPCTTTIINRIVDVFKSNQNTKKIAVNVSFDRISLRFGNKKDLILDQIASALAIIQSHGFQIYNIAHCSCDIDFSNYLKARHVDHKNVNATLWLPQKLIDFYAQMDLVIGMRGHAQMIPFGVGDKIISLGTHDKMKWFLEDIHSTDLYIDCLENPSCLSKQISDLFDEVYCSSNIGNRLHEEQDYLFEITRNNTQYIFDNVIHK